MPYDATIPRELWRKICRSAAVAGVRVMEERYGFNRSDRRRKKKWTDLVIRTINNLTEAQKLKLTEKKLLKLIDREALARINYEHFRDHVFSALRAFRDFPAQVQISFQTMPILRTVIVAAVKQEDLPFFVSLGRELSKKPPSKRIGSNRKLEQFLIEHWCEAKDGVPPLFNLSIKELYTECKNSKRLTGTNLSEHVTEKTRKQIGLIPFRPTSVKRA